jgi:hypothetical protein
MLNMYFGLTRVSQNEEGHSSISESAEKTRLPSDALLHSTPNAPLLTTPLVLLLRGPHKLVLSDTFATLASASA